MSMYNARSRAESWLCKGFLKLQLHQFDQYWWKLHFTGVKLNMFLDSFVILLRFFSATSLPWDVGFFSSVECNQLLQWRTLHSTCGKICVVMEWCMTCHICFFLPKPDWAILHKPSIIRRQKQQENLRRPPYRHQPPWCQDIPQQISRYAKWIWLGPTKGKWQEDEHATRYHWFKWRVVERS